MVMKKGWWGMLKGIERDFETTTRYEMKERL